MNPTTKRQKSILDPVKVEDRVVVGICGGAAISRAPPGWARAVPAAAAVAGDHRREGTATADPVPGEFEPEG